MFGGKFWENDDGGVLFGPRHTSTSTPHSCSAKGGILCFKFVQQQHTVCVCGGPCIRWGKCGKPRGKSFVLPENSCQVVWATIVLMRLQFLSFSFNLTMSQSLRLARARCKSDRQRKEMKRKSNGNGSSFACSRPLRLRVWTIMTLFPLSLRLNGNDINMDGNCGETAENC